MSAVKTKAKVVSFGAICDLRIEPDTRTRRKCPFHKQAEYGRVYRAYDTTRVFFDCGTMIDYGYDYWRKPEVNDGVYRT